LFRAFRPQLAKALADLQIRNEIADLQKKYCNEGASVQDLEHPHDCESLLVTANM
jgi:hypothetical protein